MKVSARFSYRGISVLVYWVWKGLCKGVGLRLCGRLVKPIRGYVCMFIFNMYMYVCVCIYSASTGYLALSVGVGAIWGLEPGELR